MRYLSVPTISFTDANGNTWPVKDIRPITSFAKGQTIPYEQGTRIDELACRPQYYGKNQEGLSWAIFEANIVPLTEQNFDLTNIRTLIIPVIGNY
jgi:hypothetical protein